MRNVKRFMAALMTAAMVFTSANVAPMSALAVYAAGGAVVTNTNGETRTYESFSDALTTTVSEAYASDNEDKSATITLNADAEVTAEDNLQVTIPLTIQLNGKELKGFENISTSSDICYSKSGDTITYAKHDPVKTYTWKKAKSGWSATDGWSVEISTYCANCKETGTEKADESKASKNTELKRYEYTEDGEVVSSKYYEDAEAAAYTVSMPYIVSVNETNQHKDGLPVFYAEMRKVDSNAKVTPTFKIVAATDEEIKKATVWNEKGTEEITGDAKANSAATCNDFGAIIYKVTVTGPDGKTVAIPTPKGNETTVYYKDSQAIDKIPHDEGKLTGIEILTSSKDKPEKYEKVTKDSEGTTLYWAWGEAKAVAEGTGTTSFDLAAEEIAEDGSFTYRPVYDCEYKAAIDCAEIVYGSEVTVSPLADATTAAEFKDGKHSKCTQWIYPNAVIRYDYTQHKGDKEKSVFTFTGKFTAEKPEAAHSHKPADVTYDYNTNNATCEKGVDIDVKCAICGETYQIEKKLDHTYGKFDGTSVAIADLKDDKLDAATQKATLETKDGVTTATVKATCIKDGGVYKYCTGENNNNTPHWDKTETLKATGHNLAKIATSVKWCDETKEDYVKGQDYTVEVVLKCANAGCPGETVTFHSAAGVDDFENIYSAVSINDEEKGADCKTAAKTTYTLNGYTDTLMKAITTSHSKGDATKGDHKYVPSAWAWSDDYETATVSGKCSVCGATTPAEPATVTQSTAADGITTFVGTYGDAKDTKKAYTLKDATVTFDASQITDPNLIAEDTEGAHKQWPEVTVTKNGTVINNDLLDITFDYDAAAKEITASATWTADVKASRAADYLDKYETATSDPVNVAPKKLIATPDFYIKEMPSENEYNEVDAPFDANKAYDVVLDEVKGVGGETIKNATVKYAIVDEEIVAKPSEAKKDPRAKQAKIEALDFNLDKVENISEAGHYYVYAQITADGYTTYTTEEALPIIIYKDYLYVAIDDATVTEGETPKLNIKVYKDPMMVETADVDPSELTITSSADVKLEDLKPGVYGLRVTSKNYALDQEFMAKHVGSLTVVAKKAEPAAEPTTPSTDSGHPKQGYIYTINGKNYKVTNKAGRIVKFKTASNKSSVAIPATVTLMDGKKYKVTVIGGNAFIYKKIKSVTVGANVKKINPKAFADSNVKTVTLKTKKLTKANVKSALKGSSVTTIKVNVGSASENKTYVAKYKKIFTKANAGKKVTVK